MERWKVPTQMGQTCSEVVSDLPFPFPLIVYSVVSLNLVSSSQKGIHVPSVSGGQVGGRARAAGTHKDPRPMLIMAMMLQSLVMTMPATNARGKTWSR